MRVALSAPHRAAMAMKGALLAGAALALSLAAAAPVRAGEGFSISVDGERVAGDAPAQATGTAGPDIQVKFDGLEVKPVLNVATLDGRRAFAAGEAVPFLASLNYPAWVVRKEVLIFEAGRNASARPFATVPVDEEGHAAWTMPATGKGEYALVLRVADAENRFDETLPLSLSRASGDLAAPPTAGRSVAPGVNEDRTALRNIPVRGGAVTVYGTDVPPGERVTALGESVPVDEKGGFVVQRILPPGEQEVQVAVSGAQGTRFSRPVVIPENEWFYVGLADLTAGKRFGDGALADAKADGYDKVWTKGRVAFYLKGKIKGSTLLTAAVNTGEGELGDLFKDFDSKDPRGILRRIDPDSYYPVYGDDSTVVEGAPTYGKFYVRLDRGDSHALWGRFKADIDRSRLLRNERTLYGAEGVYRSEAATTFGERRVEAKAYAARPGTLQARDVLRGTGGSAYFLKHQDVLRDTETITVVVTDDESGRVLSRQRLVVGEDYDINYFQGVVVLKKPLQSTTTDGRMVRDGALGESFVNLVVNYEYTPASGAVDDMAAGGEAGAWLNDHLRVGATAMKEETGLGTQRMGGVDAKLRATESTFLEAELVTTGGPGLRRTLSTDGGLTSVDEFGRRSRRGNAWSLRGEADLSDISPALKGRLQAWIEEKRAGFAALDYDIETDQRTAGLSATYDLTERTALRATIENFQDDEGRREKRAALEAEHRLSERWSVAAGVTGTELNKPLTDASGSGRRVDVGTKVTYAPDEDTSFYAFGQATVARRDGIRRNDRIGVGAARKLTETLGVEGEVSEGTTGLGALAALTYDPTADNHYYAGYRLDPDALRTTALDGLDLGGIVVGAKQRYSELLSGYAENRYDMFGRRRSLNSTYGVVYTPDRFWSFDGGIEAGRINDPNDSDFDRKAFSLGGSYKDGERLSASLKGELRLEDDSRDGSRDRTSTLASAGVTYKVSEDWRLLAGIDAVLSKSDQASILDGDFVDANLGFAYRPVAHDRLNALARYRFVYDLPGPDQVTANGETLGPAQRSNVVSADVNYDLTKLVAVGAKYGLRIGEISETREPDDFERSVAQLGVIRVDVGFAADWSALVEGRILAALESETTRKGMLAALYHDISDNMKVGAGYNFADFSDDLADLTYDDQGAFVNAVGQF